MSDKETEQTLNYLPFGQSDPFGLGNINDGSVGDFLGRYCNPQEISPLTLQSFSLNSQISENFPISGGIQFPPYPGQLGSDREFGVLASQPTTQESNKSSLLDPDSVNTKSNSRKRISIPTGNGKESPASSSLTASNSKISRENGGSQAVGRSKQDEAGSSKNGIEKCDSKGNTMDDAKPPEPPKDYIHVRARRGQAKLIAIVLLKEQEERKSARGWIALLQNLVLGCNRVTGKAVMLDIIINLCTVLTETSRVLVHEAGNGISKDGV